MKTANDLQTLLRRIDNKGYKAYKDIRGAYAFSFFTLYIDHVQGDPFAAPSKIRLRLSSAVHRLPPALFAHAHRRLGLEDFLAREIRKNIRRLARLQRGTGKSGLISIDAGGQEILPRTALKITDDFLEARLEIGLPARGRTILGREALAMFFEELPRIAEQSLQWEKVDQQAARRFAEYVENYYALQAQLSAKRLVAFVADRSVLPRESGVSPRPLSSEAAVPFRSPQELRVTLTLPHPLNGSSTISGMGIPEGITLIVGGGFHGKSTLLNALELGVYPHIPGDGREYVITRADAVKIRAEDGRRVEKVDIRPFINHLPGGKDAARFSTEDASGSTSQAANILEAMEAGSQLLLVDEDTSATNFMIRDARMQALVHKDSEPITPFIDRIREMYERFGTSTILVMGGSGDYFDVADTIIMMKEYLPYLVTEEAKAIAQTFKTERRFEREFDWQAITPRKPLRQSFDASRGKKEVKIEAKGLSTIQFGLQTIDLHAVEQLVDVSQTRAIGYALHYLARHLMDEGTTLSQLLNALENFLIRGGLEQLNPFRRGEEHPGNFALPRRFEIAAALNRYRKLHVNVSPS